MGLRGLRPVSATRPWPHFRRCSFDITACRLAVTEQFAALTATVSKRTFWKQKSPIDLDQGDEQIPKRRKSRCPHIAALMRATNSARRAGHLSSNAGCAPSIAMLRHHIVVQE